jgi:hypothetical protein
MPAFAPELILECPAVDAGADIEVSLDIVLLAVVGVRERSELVAIPPPIILALVDAVLELEVVELADPADPVELAELVECGELVELVELVELDELDELTTVVSTKSHEGEMQNHSKSVTASTGTVWPTPAADIPTSFEPSPYTILV